VQTLSPILQGGAIKRFMSILKGQLRQHLMYLKRTVPDGVRADGECLSPSWQLVTLKNHDEQVKRPSCDALAKRTHLKQHSQDQLTPLFFRYLDLSNMVLILSTFLKQQNPQSITCIFNSKSQHFLNQSLPIYSNIGFSLLLELSLLAESYTGPVV
jgi:hypothetical protein